jgi:hypothetical protein
VPVALTVVVIVALTVVVIVALTVVVTVVVPVALTVVVTVSLTVVVTVALTVVVVAGAQDGGCRFDKKPHYRYSGCHRGDASALNVALGLHFHLDDAK